MADRRVEVEGRWKGDKLEKGAKQSMGKVAAAAKKTGKATAGMVGEQTGRALSQFNEKTEKGRQLLNAFGGAMGGAAGEAVYYGGTLSYVVGRFKPLELAAMGALAALVILGKTMHDLATERLRKATEGTEKYHKATEKLTKAAEALYRAEYNLYHGIDRKKAMQQDLEFNKFWLETRISNLNEYLKKTEAQQAGAYGMASEFLGRQAKAWRLQINQVKQDLKATEKSIEAIDKASGMEAGRKARAEAEKTAGDLGGALAESAGSRADVASRRLFGVTGEQLAKATEKFLTEKEKAARDALAIEESYQRRLLKLWEQNQRRREHIEDEHDKKMGESERRRNETMFNSIGLFEEFGSMIAQNQEQRTAVFIAATIVEAAWRMQMEIAKGWAMIEYPWIAAAHFTAAGLFGAVAAGKVAGAVGGGSSGASSSERSRAQDRRNYDTDTKGDTTIIINGGVWTSRDAAREINKVLADQDKSRGGSRDKGRII